MEADTVGRQLAQVVRIIILATGAVMLGQQIVGAWVINPILVAAVLALGSAVPQAAFMSGGKPPTTPTPREELTDDGSRYPEAGKPR